MDKKQTELQEKEQEVRVNKEIKEISGKEILNELLKEFKRVPKVISVQSTPTKKETYEKQGINIGDTIKKGKGRLKVKLIYQGKVR